MIYVERILTLEDARQTFKVYRVVRLLHDLRVIKDDELIKHEEHIWNTKMIGMDINWYKYQMSAGNEVFQF